jgi:hypothetical protein
MSSNGESDASTVGCLLIIGAAGGCLGVFLALSQHEPKWFWALPVAALILWGVFVIHKEAIGPKDELEAQLARARFENIKLSETNEKLNQALSEYKSSESSEAVLKGYYGREREKLNELKQTLEWQANALKDREDKLREQIEEHRGNSTSLAQERLELHALQGKAMSELEEFWLKCWDERSAGFPDMASKAADAWLATWELEIRRLIPRASSTALEMRRKLSKEIRELKESEAIHRNLVEYYESLFPWIEEFRDEPALAEIADAEGGSDDGVRPAWVNEDEWRGLDDTQRSQLALDKYILQHKAKWEIGREYERFCGYLLEKKGWTVEYHGAVRGIDDLGRDLLARKAGRALVVQCKYWAERKEIHEKHVFQTYGTMIALRLDEPETKVEGWLATSTRLSERANKFAKALEIGVHENFRIGPFPRIKCNANSMIYHLPFDQKYDQIVMKPGTKSFYAMTAAEAVSAGYRRAKRWVG